MPGPTALVVVGPAEHKQSFLTFSDISPISPCRDHGETGFEISDVPRSRREHVKGAVTEINKPILKAE